MMRTGFKVVTLDVVDSTNNYAAILLNRGEITNGTVILAENQLNGRGQRGAVWQSNPGENLIISLFFDEVNLSVRQSFDLTKWISLSLVNYLSQIGFTSSVKWPNDIYIGENKVAGILIENQLRGDVIKSCIIGIGLNVNQVDFGALRATSLKQEGGEFRPVHEVLYGFLGYLSERPFLMWNYSELDEMYRSRLFKLNVLGNFKDSKGSFNGTILGVETNGKLMIQKENGLVSVYDLKEIEYLFD